MTLKFCNYCGKYFKPLRPDSFDKFRIEVSNHEGGGAIFTRSGQSACESCTKAVSDSIKAIIPTYIELVEGQIIENVEKKPE